MSERERVTNRTLRKTREKASEMLQQRPTEAIQIINGVFAEHHFVSQSLLASAFATMGDGEGIAGVVIEDLHNILNPDSTTEPALGVSIDTIVTADPRPITEEDVIMTDQANLLTADPHFEGNDAPVPFSRFLQTRIGMVRVEDEVVFYDRAYWENKAEDVQPKLLEGRQLYSKMDIQRKIIEEEVVQDGITRKKKVMKTTPVEVWHKTTIYMARLDREAKKLVAADYARMVETQSQQEILLVGVDLQQQQEERAAHVGEVMTAEQEKHKRTSAVEITSYTEQAHWLDYLTELKRHIGIGLGDKMMTPQQYATVISFVQKNFVAIAVAYRRICSEIADAIEAAASQEPERGKVRPNCFVVAVGNDFLPGVEEELFRRHAREEDTTQEKVVTVDGNPEETLIFAGRSTESKILRGLIFPYSRQTIKQYEKEYRQLLNQQAPRYFLALLQDDDVLTQFRAGKTATVMIGDEEVNNDGLMNVMVQRLMLEVPQAYFEYALAHIFGLSSEKLAFMPREQVLEVQATINALASVSNSISEALLTQPELTHNQLYLLDQERLRFIDKYNALLDKEMLRRFKTKDLDVIRRKHHGGPKNTPEMQTLANEVNLREQIIKGSRVPTRQDEFKRRIIAFFSMIVPAQEPQITDYESHNEHQPVAYLRAMKLYEEVKATPSVGNDEAEVALILDTKRILPIHVMRAFAAIKTDPRTIPGAYQGGENADAFRLNHDIWEALQFLQTIV